MEERYIQAVRIDWDEVPPSSWLRAVPALQGLETLSFHRNITFFAGENGTGKSTLLEAIAVAYGFNPEGGTVNYRFSTFDEGAGLGRAVQLVRGFRHAPFGYFFGPRVFSTWPARPRTTASTAGWTKRNITAATAAGPCTSSPMGRAS